MCCDTPPVLKRACDIATAHMTLGSKLSRCCRIRDAITNATSGHMTLVRNLFASEGLRLTQIGLCGLCQRARPVRSCCVWFLIATERKLWCRMNSCLKFCNLLFLYTCRVHFVLRRPLTIYLFVYFLYFSCTGTDEALIFKTTVWSSKKKSKSKNIFHLLCKTSDRCTETETFKSKACDTTLYSLSK